MKLTDRLKAAEAQQAQGKAAPLEPPGAAKGKAPGRKRPKGK